MDRPKRHIFVCGSFRASGEPQGVCHKQGSIGLMQVLEEGLADRDMPDVMISMTSCLKVCDRGPAMIIYPENYWYGGINEESLEEILDKLAEGKAAEEYLIA